MKLHRGPVFIEWYGEFNRGRSSLQHEFREGRAKSVVVPETVDAVRQLILQDRYVTYRVIKITLGISGTSIPAFNIAWTFDCQTNLYSLDPEQFVNRSKKSINQSGKSASTIGSKACKSVQIIMLNFFKNNKAIFPLPKTEEERKRFAMFEEIKEKSKQKLLAIPKSAFQKCFKDWKKRCHKCVTSEGGLLCRGQDW